MSPRFSRIRLGRLTFSPMLRLLCITSLVIALSACTTTQETPSTGTSTTATAGGDWGFLQFAEVRAYRMNWNVQHSFATLVGKDGKLNPTRLPQEGIKLNPSQVVRLRQAVTGRHPSPKMFAFCFYPHHAFAFYDEKGRCVGSIDLCFLCGNYYGEPAGFAKVWDMKSLASLVHDLGVPLSNPSWD